jgi:hypothetical protein
MLSASQIRNRVLQGLATGHLWRLTDDRAKAREGIIGQCHVCDLSIRRGQVYELSGTKSPVRIHLECYLFWLHVSGAYQPEPITCTLCRRLIPPHAEKVTVDGELYHGRCWTRRQEEAASEGQPAEQPESQRSLHRDVMFP